MRNKTLLMVISVIEYKISNKFAMKRKNLMSFIKNERARGSYFKGMRPIWLRRWNERKESGVICQPVLQP